MIEIKGSRTNFTQLNLKPNTFSSFRLTVCNNLACTSTPTIRFATDEAAPTGGLLLEAQASGSNSIQLKWSSDLTNPFSPNGHVLYAVLVTGPFLLDLNATQLVANQKANRPFTTFRTLNLLNTSTMNTRYGIIDKILPYSQYILQINASNSRGYLLTDRAQLTTFTSVPEGIIPPQKVTASPYTLQIEWYPPVLSNSADSTFYYQVEYRTKYLWNSLGPVNNASYETNVVQIFTRKTISRFHTLQGLVPFTAYSFRLTTSNAFGESKSEWSEEYLTQEATPLGQKEPRVSAITATGATISWQPPKVSNGVISFYTLNIFPATEDTSLFKNYTLTTNQLNVTGLEPFTEYITSVVACNSKGCVSSPISANNSQNRLVVFQTLASPPQGLARLGLKSLNSYSMQVN